MSGSTVATGLAFCPECGSELTPGAGCSACGKYAPRKSTTPLDVEALLSGKGTPRFQYSLLSMFLVMTLVACALAFAKATSYPLIVGSVLLFVGILAQFHFFAARRVAGIESRGLTKRDEILLYVRSFVTVLGFVLISGYFGVMCTSPGWFHVLCSVAWGIGPAPINNGVLTDEQLYPAIGGVVGLSMLYLLMTFSWPRLRPTSND
jgi:hypothetical protein